MADLAILIYPSFFVLAITLLYQVVAGAIYRLFYSPISHIPGPKIAALTFWYLLFNTHSILHSFHGHYNYMYLFKKGKVTNVFTLGMNSTTMSSYAGNTCFIYELYTPDMAQ